MAKSTGKAAEQPAKTSATASRGNKPLINKQPQSKQQAAVAGGMFLHTDDAWSRAYFAPNDLHRLERELFGGSK